MTYRDLGWTLWASTFGFVVALICVLELLRVVTDPAVVVHAWRRRCGARSQIDLWFLATSRTEHLEQRVQELTETRADLVDHSAAELRRLERDLHDGPQARLVALSMSLGLADQALRSTTRRPRGASCDDARATAQAAIGDLRSVVRGIHPAGPRRPGSDRCGRRRWRSTWRSRSTSTARWPSVRLLRSSRPSTSPSPSAWPTSASTPVPSRAGSGSTARRRGIRVVVADDGRGGADPRAGTGMLGVQRRLAAFDGTMTVSSPTGGPTEVTLEVPCDSSSPRTTPSSGPG